MVRAGRILLDPHDARSSRRRVWRMFSTAHRRTPSRPTQPARSTAMPCLARSMATFAAQPPARTGMSSSASQRPLRRQSRQGTTERVFDQESCTAHIGHGSRPTAAPEELDPLEHRALHDVTADDHQVGVAAIAEQCMRIRLGGGQRLADHSKILLLHVGAIVDLPDTQMDGRP